MSIFDWLILLTFFAYTLWDGTRHNKDSKNIEELLLAGRRMSWWAMGLSVMATQASAITFIGTTGQAFMYDMRFIQIYLGLPIAMVIICGTIIPFYYRSKAFTAYELLEKRFGLRMRLATSFLFLLSRGASLGIAIAAPAYILALVLKLPFNITIVIIGLSATIYTMFGGIGGVIRTDMKQMILMVFGLLFCFFWVIHRLPEEVSFQDALTLAGAAGKLQSIDLNLDFANKYNLWSGMLAGLFLMLSYFGTDQAQVQRYLTAKSLNDARGSLMVSAILKLPMQFFILLLGAMMYVFFIFAERPLLFMPTESHTVNHTVAQGKPVNESEKRFQCIQAERREVAFKLISEKNKECAKDYRQSFKALDQEISHLRKHEIHRLEKLHNTSRNDINYVFPHFILSELPKGVLGLIIAAILAAALSSIDSLLNSLTTVSVVDWYRRFHSRQKSPKHYLKVSRWSTAGWGLFATLSAIAFGETESIVELINKVGSYFYGAILGAFILLWVKKADGRSALIGFLCGLVVVFLVGSLYQQCEGHGFAFFFPGQYVSMAYRPVIEYLWLNPIGTSVVVLMGYFLGKRLIQTRTGLSN